MTLLAPTPPAGGAAFHEIMYAAAIAGVAIGFFGRVVLRERLDRPTFVSRIADWAAEWSGLPRWMALRSGLLRLDPAGRPRGLVGRSDPHAERPRPRTVGEPVILPDLPGRETEDSVPGWLFALGYAAVISAWLGLLLFYGWCYNQAAIGAPSPTARNSPSRTLTWRRYTRVGR